MARSAAIITRIHRIAAILFLLSVVPAGWASMRGGEPAALVYLPLLFLAGLSLTGIYQLAAPWARRYQARRRA